MNKATRMLVMTGMAVVAAATFSAGPAMADTAAPAPTQHKVTTQSQTTTENTKNWGPGWGPGGSRVVGYFSNPFTCNQVGRNGIWTHRWDYYNCYPVPFGFGGNWALRVTWHRFGFPGHGWFGGPGWGGPGIGGFGGPGWNRH
ncbi:hypothetical protein ODJ79_03670 [Actinoplanes sp. KI2]|uniref:hypothetical protein n=1 Tax=Actinoplanes sp. KI2 TaxID=2983315 RepID=UPI0021D5F8DB|nr:hypothetical protein [Actinoplanes sp. KI2]MCU7722803.1 hypothetical protein [Actinoplanes sp. KI2]